MTNIELIGALFELFRSYFTFLLPVFGVMAGVHLIFNLLWSVLFKPFDHIGG